ncbi:MAG: hypothetical protein Q7U74_16130, partial [Saprospiraceae bacterium]|nr:hypothetical protein [Saprospiraceae bacterium]
MNSQPGKPKRLILISTGILAIALGWKATLLLFDAVPFNADEAVVALMSRHILQGERPIFFYGQAYMGSLDAFFVAAGFFLFGQQVWVIRLVQALLYCGLIITTILLGRAAFGRWMVGVLAAVLMAVPTVNVTLYTTVSLGGYGEALLLGNLVLLCTIQMINRVQQNHSPHSLWRLFFIWGALSGLGMWANGLSLVYSVPAGVTLLVFLWMNRKQAIARRWTKWFIAALAGFMIGSAPWWFFAMSDGFDHLVFELLGSAVAVEQTPWL